MLKTDSKIILKILEIFNYAFIDLDRDKNIKKITKNELLLRIKNPNLFKNIQYTGMDISPKESIINSS